MKTSLYGEQQIKNDIADLTNLTDTTNFKVHQRDLCDPLHRLSICCLELNRSMQQRLPVPRPGSPSLVSPAVEC